MVAGGLDRAGRTQRGSPITRVELELAIRAELVDFGATSWHARVATDYILDIVDDYVQTRGKRFAEHLEEVLDSHLGTEPRGERGRDADLARRILKDCHRALREDLADNRGNAPSSADLGERSSDEGGG